MSTLIRIEKRAWLPVLAAVALGSLALALVVALAQNPPAEGPSSPDSAVGPRTKVLPQARWKIRAAATASGTKLERSERRIVKRERPRVVTTIKDLYESLLLGTTPVRSLGGKSLTPRAAARLASSHLGPPAAMTNVQTTRRKARIGIDVASGRRGAAQVSIALKGMIEDKKVRLAVRSTLWLEREGGRWKVIAFDATRRRR